MICLIKLVIHHHLFSLKYMAAVLSMPKDVLIQWGIIVSTRTFLGFIQFIW